MKIKKSLFNKDLNKYILYNIYYYYIIIILYNTCVLLSYNKYAAY